MRKKLKFTPQKSFQPYPEDILPQGFRYPERYLQHAKAIDYPRHLMWGFYDSSSDGSSWDLRYHWPEKGWVWLQGIDPIPFAQNGDWAAFFDGSDHSGDPKIVVVDLGNKEQGYELANFAAWLEVALKDSGIE